MDASDINQVASRFYVTYPTEGHETVLDIETRTMKIEIHKKVLTSGGLSYWIRTTGNGAYGVANRFGWVDISADEFNKIVEIQATNFQLIVLIEDIERVHTGQL